MDGAKSARPEATSNKGMRSKQDVSRSQVTQAGTYLRNKEEYFCSKRGWTNRMANYAAIVERA